MKKTLQFCFALLFFLPVLHSFAADITVIASPDRNIRFRLFLQNNQLHYGISFKNNEVITASPLVALLDNAPVTDHVRTGSVKIHAVHESYPWLGVHSNAHNQYNEASIPVTKNNLHYTLEVRVFNDGTAFRFILPGRGNEVRIPDEATVFNLPANSSVWYHDLEMHYEGVHTKKQVSQVQQGAWVAPPATFQLPQGIYAAITEADLKGYSGMALQATGKNGFVIRLAHHQPTSYPYRLRYSPEDTTRLKKPASLTGTVTTPWRVVMIGANLNSMVNNDIVQNLCAPANPALFPNGMNTSWVKPGRAVWKYLDGGGEGTLEVMKKFTDGAAALGFEHNILEGFWSRWTDEQMRELVNYSNQKNVGIWFWKHSKSLRDANARDSFFRRCADLGVIGVKLDFFDHEAKETIDLYESILNETAKYHLMVDFHGANKPTGQARTWPNEMVRESVKGMEASKLADRATHEVTIPFTRFLAGPAEYTVMHFGERRKNTTWAHQIASAAILSAPLLTYAAHPDSILANPAVNVIKAIPATWDETVVLPPSEIGEIAAFARRKGNTWFIAVMNGAQPKQINIPLTFLKSGSYKAIIVKDDPASSASVQMGQGAHTSKDVIKLNLVAGGGYVAQLSQ